MKKMLRRKLVNILIWLIEKDLSTIPRQTLSEEQYTGLMANLWANPGFQKYVADRNAKLVYTMAGPAGNDPEPRDKHLMKFGQRVEILLLAAKAKACAKQVNDKLEEKKAENN